MVVVWAGIRTADKWHNRPAANDIYYVTSKDGGQTWTDPSKVTDGAKDGLDRRDAGGRVVERHDSFVLHPGQTSRTKELSPGLTKLGGEPWPIYYTHRPFPN